MRLYTPMQPPLAWGMPNLSYPMPYTPSIGNAVNPGFSLTGWASPGVGYAPYWGMPSTSVKTSWPYGGSPWQPTWTTIQPVTERRKVINPYRLNFDTRGHHEVASAAGETPKTLQRMGQLDNKDKFETMTSLGSAKKPVAAQDRKKKTTDFWKDTSVRYLGYANDMFECWEDVIHYLFGPKRGRNIFRGALMASWTYVLGDALGNAMKTYKRAEGYPKKSRVIFGMAIAGDTAIFQYFASYWVPMLVVDALQRMTKTALWHVPATVPFFKKASPLRLLLPALVSSNVVFLIKHIDTLVKKGIDLTYWSWMNELLKKYNAPEAPVIIRPKDLRLPKNPFHFRSWGR